MEEWDSASNDFLYCVVIAPGEQMHIQRSFVLPARSIIVWIAYRRMTCSKDSPTTFKPCEMEDCR